MNRVPLVIGYDINKAIELIGEGHRIIVAETTTPYEDRKRERQGNTPIVVRQKETDDGIELVTSLFK
ncbi:MAG: hypothetical protein ACM3ZR_04655 [Pseudomonadota bacterium]